ncbi:hypothetical protein MHYMCMPASI_01085 [Hyalomma marginatum]|uniref:Uncharacterized protein n=1 Tax=Hyalomma marginatum TaxID=34627 RepID=A0A8S4C4C7_9ACAR|nr:hypothetical protein MHYMCMPASI_01085 [Hyalomma marginatum]
MDKDQSLSILTGHRSKLKERFLKSPNRTLPDYEITRNAPIQCNSQKRY